MREYIHKEIVKEFKEPDLSALYTYADYLTWENWNEWVELIRGRIHKMSAAPNRMHQTISGNLFALIHTFLRRNPCQVFAAPFDVRLPLIGTDDAIISNVVQPDISVICDPSKLDSRGCIGAPDLIVEILSPSNLEHDLKLKYELYEEAGVREYWIIYPNEKSIHSYVLENGRFTVKHSPVVGSGMITPHIFDNLELPLAEIFENI
jgi:Uma2 family endonuclease